MSAAPGWYPDPSGQPGYRYWDGRAWSAATSSAPTVGPPVSPTGAAPAPTGPRSGYPAQTPLTGADGSHPVGPGVPPARSGRVGLIVGGAVVLGVVLLAVVLIVRSLSAPGPITAPPPPTDPTSGSTVVSCPRATTASSGSPLTRNGRVISGKLSYPVLTSPWSLPLNDTRVPFGRDVQSQTVVLERLNGKATWAANVLIARLLAGDGFFGPEQGSKIVTSCILGKFYGDARIARHDTRNQAVRIDGHSGWLLESHLTYDIPDVKARGELLIVAVVDVGGGEGGLFYASIPDTAPQLVGPARKALADLQVS